MNVQIVAAAAVWLMVLSGGTGYAYGEPRVPPATGRPAEEASAIDAMALGSALAENTVQLSGPFGPFSLTVGVDVWLNQWQTGTASNNVQGGFKNVTETALGVGIIPNVTLSYQRFFVSASYMWTPDYDFGTTTDIVNAFGVAVVREVSTKASRQEVEATLGYRFFETDQGFIAAAAGYKGIFQDYVTASRFASGDAPGNFFTPFTRQGQHTKTNYHGWFAGLVASASLGAGLGLFGNAAGGVLYPDCRPSCDDFGATPYAAAKLGLAYRPFDVPLTFALGYRVQILNTQVRGVTSRGGNAIDLTHGIVVGANWRF